MHQDNFKLACAVLLALMLFLSGCFGGGSQTPATRFYVLNSLYSAENINPPKPVVVLEDATVGVGPIKLSQVLDPPLSIMLTIQIKNR